MEELNLEGIFWLDTNPDDQVAGRLTFDTINGAHLGLIGSLHRLGEAFGKSAGPVRIHGLAEGKKLTLVDCYRSNTLMQIPGIVREQYRPLHVLSGVQLGENQPLEFDGVRLKLLHLDSWVWKTGTTTDISRDNHSTGIEKIQITCTLLENESFPTDDGELELIFTYDFNPDPFRITTLTQSTLLGVQFSEPCPLLSIFETCTALRNLLTIGVGAPAFATEVSLTRSDSTRDVGGGETSPIPIGLYNQGLGDATQREVKNIHPLEMLFTYDDIGELQGIAAWLETSAKFKPVIGSLLSHWYLPTMYTDNRFLNIIIAAEALERIRRNRQSVNFSEGLESLADLAGDPFRSLVQDVQPWANEIIRARTNHLVHRGLHGDMDGLRMHWLAESLYFLVVLCLLRECGVPEKVLSKIQQNQRFKHTYEQLQLTK